MLTTTEGVSFTWLAFWAVFLVINLSLAWRAHRALPSRVTRQTLAVYWTWSVLIALNLFVFIVRGKLLWTGIDTVTSAIALAGIMVTLAAGARHGLGIGDGLVRGWLAVFFKAVPQLALAWSVLVHGGGGVSAVVIIGGHLTICTRLGQILLALREAGWDRNRRGAAISEFANEGSWIVATVAWLIAD